MPDGPLKWHRPILPRRHVVAVAIHRGGPLVVCDDGALWWYCPDLGEWTDYPPVPGTEADKEHDHA